MNVLIADDNEVMRNLLKFYLKKYNVEIDEVTDGLEVLKKGKEKEYNLLFLDIYMPHLDGINVVKYLKEHGNDVEIILISGNIEADIILELQKFKIKYFLSKPIEITKFHEIMEEITVPVNNEQI